MAVDPLTAGVIASGVVSGASSIGSGIMGLINNDYNKEQNEWNKRFAQKQFDYSKYVTENGKQIMANDLEKAGLSKALAAGETAQTNISPNRGAQEISLNNPFDGIANAAQGFSQNLISSNLAIADRALKTAETAESGERKNYVIQQKNESIAREASEKARKEQIEEGTKKIKQEIENLKAQKGVYITQADLNRATAALQQVEEAIKVNDLNINEIMNMKSNEQMNFWTTLKAFGNGIARWLGRENTAPMSQYDIHKSEEFAREHYEKNKHIYQKAGINGPDELWKLGRFNQ